MQGLHYAIFSTGFWSDHYLLRTLLEILEGTCDDWVDDHLTYVLATKQTFKSGFFGLC